MRFRHVCIFSLSALSWAQTPWRGELSLSQAERVFQGGSPTIYGDGKVTTIGVGGELGLTPKNAFRLRLEQSIHAEPLPAHDPAKPDVRRDSKFQSLSFAYLHWFSSEAESGWFIGPTVSINRVTQDRNSLVPYESISSSPRAAFISGYQFGAHLSLELHAGVPWSSASLVFRF
jgi:hypothetical protein